MSKEACHPHSSSSSSSISNCYILLKSHYFLSYACFASINPILNIILRHRGLSNLEISYINLIVPFVVFFTNPILGIFLDHTRHFRSLFTLILSLTIVLLLAIFFLPAIRTFEIQGQIYPQDQFNRSALHFYADDDFAIKCSRRSHCGCVYQASCRSIIDRSKFHLNFTMNGAVIHKNRYRIGLESKSSFYAQCQITCSIDNICGGSRHPNEVFRVLLYSFLIILAMSFFANITAIGTSLGFAILHHSKLFGRQRLWGTVGYGSTAFLTSRLYQSFQTNYVYLLVFVITSSLCIVVTCLIRHSQSNEDEEMKGEGKEKFLREQTEGKNRLEKLLPLLKNVDVLIFLSTTFLWGMSFSAIDPYLLLYIDEISPCESHSLAGYVSLITSTFEILALFIAHKLLRYFGIQMTTIMIFLAFSIRFSGYYFISQPYLMLPFETMHFFNFGILFVLIAQEAFTIAPADLGGTLQGIVHGISFGLGRGIGLFLSLVIYTGEKKSRLFLVYAMINLGGALLYVIYWIWGKWRSKSADVSEDITPKKSAG